MGTRRLMLAIVSAGLAGLAAAGVGTADQPKATAASADQRAFNKLVSAALKEVHDTGAKLYNDDDAAGCYRVFQGGLLAARGMFSQQPELQQFIDEGLKKADTKDSIKARAFALHDLIEQVRKRVRANPEAEPAAEKKTTASAPVDKSPAPAPMPANPDTKPADTPKQPANTPASTPPSNPVTTPATPVLPPTGEKSLVDPKATTLWGRLGGGANVRQIVNDFVTLAASDAKVDFTRGGKFAPSDDTMTHLKREISDFISDAAGGPFHYTGKSMKEAHQGMGITAAQFDASVADLKTALEKNGVQPADVKAVLTAVEATRKDIVETEPKP